MRKWTYLVAALLMSGTAATFTSCIDTTEPAGIENLRGAKADFIRAKAAYQDAVTQLELVKVQREEIYKQMEEIDLQMKQIDLELKQANADYLIEEWTQKKNLLIEKYAALMVNAKAETAKAQAALVEALAKLEIAELTGRDDAFATEIVEVRGLLNNFLYNLPILQDDLYQAQMAKLQYETRNKNYVYGRELAIAEKEYDLNIYKKLLESYEAITDPNDKAELNAQKAEIQNQINALDKEEAAAVMAIQEARISGVLAEASREAEGIMNELSKDTTFLIPAAQVDDAILEKLLNDFSVTDLSNLEINESLDLIETSIRGLGDRILDPKQSDYLNDYQRLIGNYYYFEIFDENGQVKQSYAAKVQAEKERIMIDIANIKVQYDAAVKAWVDGYISYQKALEAYGYAGVENASQNINRSTAEKAYQTFVTAYEASTATDATKAAAAKTFRTAIQKYAALRNPVDGAAEDGLENFNSTYDIVPASGTTLAVDPLDTPATVYMLYSNADWAIDNNGYFNWLGAADLRTGISNSEYTNYPSDGASSLHKFMKAAYVLFGNYAGSDYDYTAYLNIQTIKVPVLADVTTAPTDYNTAIATDWEDTVWEGAYADYLAAYDFDGRFTGIATYDKWLALYNYINSQADLVEARVDDLNNQKDAIIEKYEDAYMQVWEAELQAYLIKGNISVRINNQTYTVISNDNPYYEYINSVSTDMTEGGVSYSELTKLSALQRQQKIIEDAIASGTLVYVTYDETTNQYTTTNGTKALQTLIEETKEDIALIEQSIAEYKDQIAWFNEYGWDNDKTKAYYDNQINSKQQIVDNMEANIKLYTAQLQKLLDAIAAE